MNNFEPKLSIIIPTRNNEKDILFCLRSLVTQSYKKIEIIVVDGMSTDRTRLIANEYNAKIYDNKDLLAEPGVNLGMQKSKGDLMMIIAVDNIFKNTNSIKDIVNVFKDKSIYAAFPKHDSDNTDTLFTIYTNTFTDPFNHFVYGDAANARTFHKIYKSLDRTKTYEVYDYNSNDVKPMIAFAQGFTIRSGYIRSQEDAKDDLTPILKLIEHNFKIAYVYSVPLFHHTVRDMNHFIRKTRWATENSLNKTTYGINFRREKLSWKQNLKIKLWPLYALTLIAPTIRAIIGVLMDRQLIWLFHPFICFLSASASLYQVFLYNVNKNSTISRQ